MNKHCEYKSNGDFVIGAPVSILLYFAPSANFIKALVLLALIFLIVVDSSTAIRKLLLQVNVSRNLNIFLVAKASTLISSIRSTLLASPPTELFNSVVSRFVRFAFHIYTFYDILSDRCIGNSLFLQFVYTPFGATIIAVSIFVCQ